jgi:hypothetical protein
MPLPSFITGKRIWIVFEYKGETKVLPVAFKDVQQAQSQAGKRLSGVLYLPITAKDAAQALEIYQNEKHKINNQKEVKP